jgi:AraC-like DNA-binding protein
VKTFNPVKDTEVFKVLDEFEINTNSEFVETKNNAKIFNNQKRTKKNFEVSLIDFLKNCWKNFIESFKASELTCISIMLHKKQVSIMDINFELRFTSFSYFNRKFEAVQNDLTFSRK